MYVCIIYGFAEVWLRDVKEFLNPETVVFMQIEEVKVDGEKKLSVKKKGVETKVSLLYLL
jgi:hypothetical protein